MAKNKEIIKLVDKEIEWCLCHIATSISGDFRNGFIAGLTQIRLMIKKYDGGDK